MNRLNLSMDDFEPDHETHEGPIWTDDEAQRRYADAYGGALKRAAEARAAAREELADAVRGLKKLSGYGMYNLIDWSDATKRLGEASHAIGDDLNADARAAVLRLGSDAEFVCRTFDRSMEVRATAREQVGVGCDVVLGLLG